jgi:DNA mismatch repair protein MutL
MTDVIALLPDSVANQIAAGEVIQRPASVIKELVENAVDAGAKTINVLVVDAGRTSIQVIDDGCGMSMTDARLAFERHATSKIRQADDLFSLHTMGFRGEALPSIAAVSQVELRTRRPEDEVGTCITLSGSRVVGQEPCSCSVGCSFTVSNLFFNVPARRKFLKTNATELNNILTAFERIVLVYPDINFTLHSNGQELMNLRSGSLRQRITDVYGRRYGQDLLPVGVETSLCRITGFVAKPEAARKKGVHECFFVNGRYMKHPYFHKAVAQAYDRLIPAGAHVPYFIYFEVSPADIDVNIHPTKTEIKFENEQPIWQILTAAVHDAIGQFCEIPQIDFDTEGRPDIPAYDPSAINPHPSSISPHPSYNPFRQKPSQDWQRLYDGLPSAEKEEPAPSLFDQDNSPSSDTQNNSRSSFLLPPSSNLSLLPPSSNISSDISPIHYQYKGRYIMTAVKSGLMVIDQHRADVRIRYERYLRQLADTPSQTQRLLFPETVDFTPAEAALIPDLLPALSAVGFDLTSLGPVSYAVSGVPADIEGIDPVALLHDILADAADVSTLNSHCNATLSKREFSTLNSQFSTLNSQLALTLARKAAISYGEVLSNDEMDTLVNHLFACSDVNHTPDGKTILSILPQQDIERLMA